jgi:hypothetical protein
MLAVSTQPLVFGIQRWYLSEVGSRGGEGIVWTPDSELEFEIHGNVQVVTFGFRRGKGRFRCGFHLMQ